MTDTDLIELARLQGLLAEKWRWADEPPDLGDAVALAERLAQRLREARVCEWTEDSDGTWNSACGHAWVFTDGSPAGNECVYCCFCAGKIAQCSYQDEPDEDELTDEGKP